MASPGCLYVVAVPIGHPKDITLRAIETLQTVDGVICEEHREGSALLKQLGIAKELVLLNEHTEKASTADLVSQMQQGRSFALISDCGTPVFSDPGHMLIRGLVEAGVAVVPIPGPSSLTAALSLCDFKIERFLFEGFLPRSRDQRRRRLVELAAAGLPIVLMDAPYRLTDLLRSVAEVLGGQRQIILACDLTLPGERVYRGPVATVLQQLAQRKSEFVLIVKS
ncbi:MAG: 16S rRNA (cytidine(1402)-2'-O)-methyltransferase [Chloroflexi bacterium]|nr:16S rRNA (cytidine(1402)-2'-O)-methyltransferase [Chloroflexota bacterium]